VCPELLRKLIDARTDGVEVVGLRLQEAIGLGHLGPGECRLSDQAEYDSGGGEANEETSEE
jgi:hypothetical protein